MSDIAEKLLESIATEEANADSAARSKYVRHRPGGTYKEFRPRDEERYQAILRRCAADRKTVIRCQEALLTNNQMLVHFAKQTLRERAEAYDVEVDGV